MSPKDALKIVDTICANVQLNRKEHVAVIEAINVLRGLLPQTDKEEPKKAVGKPIPEVPKK